MLLFVYREIFCWISTWDNILKATRLYHCRVDQLVDNFKENEESKNGKEKHPLLHVQKILDQYRA